MPQYCYRCESCGHEFSRIVMMSERTEATENPCELCLTGKVRQVITPVGLSGEKLKAAGGYKDVVKKMKENYPGNTLPDY